MLAGQSPLSIKPEYVVRLHQNTMIDNGLSKDTRK